MSRRCRFHKKETNEREIEEFSEKEGFEETSESEFDPDYEVETDILSEGSYETEEISYHIVSDNENDEANININEKSLKKRNLPNKTTRPKTSWVWKFFEYNEDNTRTICQIEGCKKSLQWCGSPSSMKTHLSGAYQITKAIATKYKVEDLTKNLIEDLNNLIIIEENTKDTFKPHHISK